MFPHHRRFLCLLLPLVFIRLESARAVVTVNSAQTITHRVQVQPIRVKKTTGETAVLFGNPAQEIYIKTQVNRIFAQIGVRIDWLPVNDYVSDFAYDGSPNNYTSTERPASHLGSIISGASVPPRSSSALVINMFFVEIVPGFEQLPENYANGLANYDFNGIAIQIGNVLPTYEAGQDVAAHVISHEICHNLGLDHTASGSNNLMASTGATSARLTATQKNTIFTNHSGIDGFELAQTLPPASNYDQWDVANTVPGGPGDDPDGDGLKNVIEFMFGLNPHTFSQLPQPVAGANGLTWTLPKQAGAVADGLVYQVETSNNLTNWASTGADSGRSTVVQNDASAVVVRLDAGGTARFMRLNVNIPSSVAGYSLTILPPSETPSTPPPYPGDWMAAEPPGD